MKSKSIRLTGTSYAVLALLDQCGGEATSYELKQALESSVENFWPVPHTTAYEEPARLAAGGYLTGRHRLAENAHLTEPGPLLASRVAGHQGKKEELEEYLAGVRGVEGMERAERTLIVGITYEQKMLELLELMADAAAART